MFTKEAMQARYAELCAQRDAVNASIEPLKAKMAEANERAMAAQAQAQALAAEIDKARGGGQAWLDLKKEIGLIAAALSGRTAPAPTDKAE